MLTFSEGINEACTSVQITNDDVLENDENFNLNLDTDAPRVTLNPEEGSVLIIDGDGK